VEVAGDREPAGPPAEFRWLTPVEFSRGEIAFGGGVLLLTLGFPWLVDSLAEALGVRGLAALLVGLALAGLVASRALARRVSIGQGPLRLGRAGLVALPLAAFVLDDLRPLLFVPALVQGALALLFLGSLRRRESLIESVIFWLVPVAPEFVRPYSRALTVLWGGVFLACALAIGWFAWIGDGEAWSAFSGTWMWVGMSVLGLVEFLIRKTYFRNYFHQGPFERLWARLFPAEATPMGRRSHAYIEEMRVRMQGQQRFQSQERES